MNITQAILLGILQGLTEFLPVSSSGHLVLLQNFFGLKEPELFFDISLHLGTLAATCIVFYKEIGSILGVLIRLPASLKSSGGFGVLFAEDEFFRLAVLIVVGSVPTAILGVLFNKIVNQIFGAVWIVGLMLLVTGTVLHLTRNIRLQGRSRDRMGIKDALLIGLVQGLAIIPGISRSGSTISAALYLKIDRELAGRYSFLLSIPAILGALVMGLNSDAIGGTASFAAIIFGAAAAGVVGYFALKTLLHVVKQGRLYLFAPYCWVAGAVALLISA
jgi:undecaprenyl-diphosphatase